MFGRRLSHAGHSHHTEHPHPAAQAGVAHAPRRGRARGARPADRAAARPRQLRLLGERQRRATRSAARRSTAPGRTTTSSPASATPHRVAVDSKFIYWTRQHADQHRAREPGRQRRRTPTSSRPASTIRTGIAVTSTTGIYWANTTRDRHDRPRQHRWQQSSRQLRHAGGTNICGLAADQSFLYWLDSRRPPQIGRAPVWAAATGDPSFITASRQTHGAASRSIRSFLYWTTARTERRPGAGRRWHAAVRTSFPTNDQRPSSAASAVNSQFIFWSERRPRAGIGRANINGSAPNPSLDPPRVTSTPTCSPPPPPTRSRSTPSARTRRRARRASTPRCRGRAR